MTELVEFKKELKCAQVKDRKILKQLTKEISEAGLRFTKITAVPQAYFEMLFPLLAREIQVEYVLSNSGITEIPDMITVDFNIFLDKILKRVRTIYNANQSIINAMENDKIINYIDLERLFTHIIHSKLPYEITFKILGMAVAFDAKYLETHNLLEQNNFHYVGLLANYFEPSGNSVLIEDVSAFQKSLQILANDIISSEETLSGQKIIEQTGIREKFSQLLAEYTKILIKNNERMKMDIADKKEEKKDGKFVSNGKKTITTSMEKLKKYYRNGILVELPENIEDFYALLDECNIDSTEKKYILSLIEEKVAKLNENKILKYLSNDFKNIYENAISLLNSMHYTNNDYYLLVQLIEDLKTAGEILDETNLDEDKDYIFEQIEETMESMKVIVEKHFGENKNDSENNIVFLCNDSKVPFLKEDIDRLDGSFYKMVCNGIKKIRKDNQGNFRLVMTNDNISYRLYDILSSKIHLTFIEIDNGIYLIIGADIVSQGYEEMVRRVTSSKNSIDELEKLLKSPATRNDILNNHEKYLEMFNPGSPNIIRKRTTN